MALKDIKDIDENVIRRYLLGILPEAEQIYLEERLFDKKVLDLCDLIESELIDDYTFHRLSLDDKKSFERNYLITPARLEKVRTIKFLSSYVSVTKPSVASRISASLLSSFFRSPRFAWGMLTIVCLAGGFLALQAQNQRERLQANLEYQQTKQQEIREQLDAEASRLASSQEEITRLQQELEDSKTEEKKIKELLSSTRNGVLPAIITLQSSGARGSGSIQVINIKRNMGFIAFRLITNKELASNIYRVILKNQNNLQEAIEISGLKSKRINGQEYILVAVPSSHLASGDYILLLQVKTTVNEFEDIDSFPIRLKKN